MMLIKMLCGGLTRNQREVYGGMLCFDLAITFPLAVQHTF